LNEDYVRFLSFLVPPTLFSLYAFLLRTWWCLCSFSDRVLFLYRCILIVLIEGIPSSCAKMGKKHTNTLIERERERERERENYL
jgi:hypothetical protein